MTRTDTELAEAVRQEATATASALSKLRNAILRAERAGLTVEYDTHEVMFANGMVLVHAVTHIARVSREEL